MSLVDLTLPTLTVSFIYCIWNGLVRFQKKREWMIRERVAFMLWLSANLST